ncbi:MAG TPA: hypothetical protein VHD90_02575 [Phototrophicaceae bacterium]|nr:hypothetical protein [Phototrophicaceae bacterium]
MMAEKSQLGYLEWQALLILYRNRDRASSPLRYVGLPSTVTSLIKHRPPLAQWVGKPSEQLIHITSAGISLYEVDDQA